MLGSVVRSLADRVVAPVIGSVVEPVLEPLVRPVAESVSGLQSPSLSLPGLADLPDLAGVVDLVDPSDLSDGFAQSSGQAGTPLPAPVTTAPQSSSPHGPRRPAAGEPAADGVGGQRRTTARTVTEGMTFGPRAAAALDASATGGALSAHRPPPTHHAPAHQISVHQAPAPAQQAPAGGSEGAVSGQSTADAGTSRHVDMHAVTLSDGTPLRLVTGVGTRAEKAGTRDGHRDIRVFPG